MPFIVIILFGALASGFALILELLAVSLFSIPDQTLFASIPFVPEGTLSSKVLLVLLCIAFIEEASKYIFLRQYARQFSAYAAAVVKNTLILGTLFGFGFTASEILLLLNASAVHPFSALLGTAAVHIATSSAFALFLFPSSGSSRQWLEKRPFSALSLISAAALFHTLYNLAVLFSA